jgi:2-(1,2-epoxy-1,2-dihydrophenyl)acetyl-CoA isomerase
VVQSSDPITLLVDGTVATIRLNRPSVLNAIDAEAARAFLDIVCTIAERSDIRVIVLRGEGRAFCAGGDVARFGGSDPEAAIDDIISPLHEALRLLDSLPQPSVAVIHGAAAGAGFSLMLACDFALAAETARFTLAYARIGTSPDGSATYHLPRIVGIRKAKELALLADTIDAAEALRLGLVNWVVPEAELDDACARLAARLASGPTAAYRGIRDLLASSFENDLEGQLEAERQTFKALSRTQDFREGVSAFLGKVPAQFKGY